MKSLTYLLQLLFSSVLLLSVKVWSHPQDHKSPRNLPGKITREDLGQPVQKFGVCSIYKSDQAGIFFL